MGLILYMLLLILVILLVNLVDVGFSSAPLFEDVDGDGDLDLLSGERQGRFVYFLNVGGVFLRAE